MFKRVWDYLTDPDEIASGLIVISSIVMAGASLIVAVTI